MASPLLMPVSSEFDGSVLLLHMVGTYTPAEFRAAVANPARSADQIKAIVSAGGPPNVITGVAEPLLQLRLDGPQVLLHLAEQPGRHRAGRDQGRARGEVTDGLATWSSDPVATR